MRSLRSRPRSSATAERQLSRSLGSVRRGATGPRAPGSSSAATGSPCSTQRDPRRRLHLAGGRLAGRADAAGRRPSASCSATASSSRPDDPTPSTDWPTTIPSGFPLTSGWPEDDGSSEFQLDQPSADNQAMIPAGELQACGYSPVDPGALDRLTTRLSDGSDCYVRELQLFPTDQEAVTYLAQLRALYRGCPTDDQNGDAADLHDQVDRGRGRRRVRRDHASVGRGDRPRPSSTWSGSATPSWSTSRATRAWRRRHRTWPP